MNWHKGEYWLTDEWDKLDVDCIHAWLISTYWAGSRTRETVEKSMRHSLCFGMFENRTPIGFARVVTDHSTHGYLCDVFVAQEHRGQGLGTWMLQCILDHPDLRTSRLDLFTRDAQEFYQKFGFAKHRYDCMVRYPEHYAGGSTSSTAS